MNKKLKVLLAFVLLSVLPRHVYAQLDCRKIHDTYYISSSIGNNKYDGKSESTPLRDISALPTRSNVIIRLKSGDIFFERVTGLKNCILESYGKGDQPLICGFKILTNPKAWEYSKEDVWYVDLSKEANFTGYLADKATDKNSANNVGLIYDVKKDKVYGHLVQYKTKLKEDGDFYLTELHKPAEIKKNPLDTLYFKISKNPQSMGCLCFSMNGVGISQISNSVIRDIAVVGFSCHGITSCQNTAIENCSIDLIGGQNFIKDRWWSRLGNGIEFWAGVNGVSGNTVRNCLISRCYDCGVTIQGKESEIKNPKDIHFINNRFYHCRQAFEHFINPSTQTQVLYDNCSFSGNVCYEMGETEMSSPDARCANIMNYEEKVRPLDITGNIFYGAAHHCGFCFAPGMKNNMVYVMEGQYLNHYHGKKNYQTIHAKSSADIQAYKKKSGDESTIIILKSGSLKNYLVRKKIKDMVNWSVNGSLKKYINEL